MGIIEFGWLMSQNNDVRHGAREAARLAAVDAGSIAAMGSAACDAMDLTTGATVTFTDSGTVGSQSTVSVQATVTSLTGFPGVTAVLPANLTSTVQITLEQPSSSWATGTHNC
jgi:Flp pilus assembly protein TadG